MKKQIPIFILLILSIILISFKVNYEKREVVISSSITPDSFVVSKIAKTTSFKNLAVFFFSGNQELNDINYVTLSEALEKDYVVLHETGSVNELAITNKSDRFIFIHAGDIVKGGKQDRTIGADIIVAPDIKDLPLASFCVESSRWTQRGSERADQFSVNAEMLPSRNLKMAAKDAQDQSMVWNTISIQQEKLNENVSKMKGESIDVRSSESATSLQLTLENQDLDSLRNVYRQYLEALPDEGKSIIGFAYAINGELYGADVYNNSQLFLDMWPKLLNSIIVEAIAEYQSDTVEYTLPENVVASLNQVYTGDTSTQNINPSTRQITYDTKMLIAHHCYDLAHDGWLHKSYIVKDTTQAQSNYRIDFDRRSNRNDQEQYQYYDNNPPANLEIQQIQPEEPVQQQK